MKMLAINGSPRKQYNTHALLESGLAGAAQAGAETEMVNLIDLTFSPCKSCLACKSRARPQDGRCVLKDDLQPLAEKVLSASALLLGSPIYFYTESALFRAFMERILFPLTRYAATDRSLYKGIKPVGLIYTMNITEEETKGRKPPFPQPFTLDIVEKTSYFFTRAFGYCATLLCTDTAQVRDYSKYHMEIFDAEEKGKRHREVFPQDLEKAYNLGRALIEKYESSMEKIHAEAD